MKFWILWGFDALAAAVMLYFFFVGLWDGSVSFSNIGLWMVILLVLGGVLGGSILLRHVGYSVAAWIFLVLLALPGLLGGLFFLLAIILHPKWN
jgi:hypothetical protein